MDQSLARASQCPDLISQSSQVVGQHAHGDSASSFLILLLWLPLPSVRARCRLMRQGDAAGWRPAAEHEAGFNGQPFDPNPRDLADRRAAMRPYRPEHGAGQYAQPSFPVAARARPKHGLRQTSQPSFPVAARPKHGARQLYKP